ncbi:MAG: hypothetical protein FVQ79_02735 [Planctomycetes bacterium]|nr:hypothetical protein [Planctomycetota bacterium]
MKDLRRSPSFAAILSIAALVLTFSGISFAAPEIYSFTNITNNNTTDALIGENQMSLIVHDEGTSLVRFCFANAGPAASSITDVYWDDNSGLLTSIQSFGANTGTVAFSEGADPGNLPGGGDILPVFSADFSADSDPPIPHNGVNPIEELCVLFNVQNGFEGIIGAMNSGQLRVGIHVQAYDSGGSESFITTGDNGVTIIPEPASMILAMIGMSLVGGLKKRLQ